MAGDVSDISSNILYTYFGRIVSSGLCLDRVFSFTSLRYLKLSMSERSKIKLSLGYF
jgi:hypothetical protein